MMQTAAPENRLPSIKGVAGPECGTCASAEVIAQPHAQHPAVGWWLELAFCWWGVNPVLQDLKGSRREAINPGSRGSVSIPRRLHDLTFVRFLLSTSDLQMVDSSWDTTASAAQTGARTLAALKMESGHCLLWGSWRCAAQVRAEEVCGHRPG